VPALEVFAMGPEWIVVIAVALVLFGGTQIPKLARSLGQAQQEFKKGLDEGAKSDEDDKPKPAAG
jgi:sec-independent protein translocase protein TatA